MRTTAHQGLPQKPMHPWGNFIRSNRAPMPATICSMPSGNVGCARAPRTANVQQATALRYLRKPCISQLIYTTNKNKKKNKAGQRLLNCEKERRSTVRPGRPHEALPGSALAEKVDQPWRTIKSAKCTACGRLKPMQSTHLTTMVHKVHFSGMQALTRRRR
jgi:hypothetical protein